MEFRNQVVARVRSAGGEWIKVVRDGDRAVARAGVRAPMPRTPRTRGRSVRIDPREGPMGSTVTGVASSGRARVKTDLRRRVVGLCLACRVGGWGTGGRLSPASVRGPSGGRGRCGHVHSLRTERDGAVSRRYGARSGTTRSKASQRVGGDDTDTSLAGEGRRRNISPSAANDRARRDTGAGNSPDGRTCWDTHRVHPLTRTVESRDVRVGRGGAEARASSAFLFSASAFSVVPKP